MTRPDPWVFDNRSLGEILNDMPRPDGGNSGASAAGGERVRKIDEFSQSSFTPQKDDDDIEFP